LRPLAQKDAARIGTAGPAYGGASASANEWDMTANQTVETADPFSPQLPYLKIENKTDIDLGSESNLENRSVDLEMDSTASGDATLDNTRVDIIGMDSDHSADVSANQSHADDDILGTTMVEDSGTLDSYLDHPDDYRDSNDSDHAAIRPYEEYSNESPIKFDSSNDDYVIDDSVVEADRYEKDFDDDDDEWVDISLGDNKS